MDYGTSPRTSYCTVERAAGNAAVICHVLVECTAGDFSIILDQVALKCAAGQLAPVSDARNAQTDVARIETCLRRYEEFPPFRNLSHSTNALRSPPCCQGL